MRAVLVINSSNITESFRAYSLYARFLSFCDQIMRAVSWSVIAGVSRDCARSIATLLTLQRLRIACYRQGVRKS